MLVVKFAAPPFETKHPGMISGFDRGLRDLLFGEIEKKVRFFHGFLQYSVALNNLSQQSSKLIDIRLMRC